MTIGIRNSRWINCSWPTDKNWIKLGILYSEFLGRHKILCHVISKCLGGYLRAACIIKSKSICYRSPSCRQLNFILAKRNNTFASYRIWTFVNPACKSVTVLLWYRHNSEFVACRNFHTCFWNRTAVRVENRRCTLSFNYSNRKGARNTLRSYIVWGCNRFSVVIFKRYCKPRCADFNKIIIIFVCTKTRIIACRVSADWRNINGFGFADCNFGISEPKSVNINVCALRIVQTLKRLTVFIFNIRLVFWSAPTEKTLIFCDVGSNICRIGQYKFLVILYGIWFIQPNTAAYHTI